jgi:hypothetical protein
MFLVGFTQSGRGKVTIFTQKRDFDKNLVFCIVFGCIVLHFATEICVKEWFVLIDFKVSAEQRFLSFHRFDILIDELFNLLICRYRVFIFV